MSTWWFLIFYLFILDMFSIMIFHETWRSMFTELEEQEEQGK